MDEMAELREDLRAAVVADMRARAEKHCADANLIFARSVADRRQLTSDEYQGIKSHFELMGSLRASAASIEFDGGPPSPCTWALV